MLAIYRLFFVIFLLTFIGAQNAHATDAASDWQKSDKIRARITEAGGQLVIEIEPEPKWHTYYKEPGDAGIPTEFNFTGSKDFDVQEVIFPKFEVLDEYGFKTNAYEGLTKFAVKANAGEQPHIKLSVLGAVCSEICIPYEFKFDYKPKTLSAAADIEATTEPQNGGLSLYIIGVALLAGFILNIMPCVLPVLSLKVLSVLKQSGKARKHARINFIATSSGIIASFLALAFITISLRSAGDAVGWGLHFQSPYFVAALLVITLLFAISLLGFFHLNPPSWVSGSGANKDSFTGNFFAGVLATLLGTSCTAPVLVTAVGYALTGTNLDIIVIFLTMGIGMALPFLIFAARPSLVGYLPKPGKWMVKVKHAMGVLLLLTAAWLGFVLYSQTSGEMDTSGWQKLDEAKISQLVEENRVVFVDVTAKWCVNCKANKLAVIDSAETQELFTQNKVVLMQGDMTKPSSELLAYIKKFGRYGIPVNVVYGPSAKEGILLDALLTKDAVKEAITKAQ